MTITRGTMERFAKTSSWSFLEFYQGLLYFCGFLPAIVSFSSPSSTESTKNGGFLVSCVSTACLASGTIPFPVSICATNSSSSSTPSHNLLLRPRFCFRLVDNAVLCLQCLWNANSSAVWILSNLLLLTVSVYTTPQLFRCATLNWVYSGTKSQWVSPVRRSTVFCPD